MDMTTPPPTWLLLWLAVSAAQLASPAQAQGYWIVYPSDCAADCYPSVNVPSAYTSCQSACNNCLLSYGCYSSFYPYFSPSSSGFLAFTTGTCSCYWPWWAWLLLGVGIFFFVFICCPFIIICLCFKGLLNRGKGRNEGQVPPPPAEAYVPSNAPYPDASTVPPPGMPPGGAPAPPPPMYAAPPPPPHPQYG